LERIDYQRATEKLAKTNNEAAHSDYKKQRFFSNTNHFHDKKIRLTAKNLHQWLAGVLMGAGFTSWMQARKESPKAILSHYWRCGPSLQKAFSFWM